MEQNPQEITRVLLEWRKGEAEAFDRLVPLVYDDLHRVASGLMRRERIDHTLQATALLHELYFRLVAQRHPNEWVDRAHFFTFASKMMRLILVDHAREHKAQRRGGDRIKLQLGEELSWLNEPEAQVIDLDRALDKLATMDARKARIAELRFFLSFGVDEIADLLAISKATVDRELKFIRAWLFRELQGEAEPAGLG